MLAIAMQALVPGGYMVGASPKDGAIAITLCTSSGTISAFIDAEGQITETKPGSHTPSPDTDDTKSVCAFSGHVTTAFVPDELALDAPNPSFEAQTATPLRATLIPGLGLAAPPPPKTGPPIQA
jgi:hypothetical protein